MKTKLRAKNLTHNFTDCKSCGVAMWRCPECKTLYGEDFVTTTKIHCDNGEHICNDCVEEKLSRMSVFNRA